MFAVDSFTIAEIEEIQRTNKPKGTAFFMGSSAQRAMLHVVTAHEVETLFSRDIDVNAFLTEMYGTYAVTASDAEPQSEQSAGASELAHAIAETENTKEKRKSGVDIPPTV